MQNDHQAGLSAFTVLYQKMLGFAVKCGIGQWPFVQALYGLFTRIISAIPMPVVTTRDGMKVHQNLFIVLHGPDYSREFETSTSTILKRELHEGQVVLDIGANVGYYTCVLAQHVGSAGKVFAFEPGRNNLRMLRKTVKANGCTNVMVVDKAVSDTSGSADFFEHGAQSSIDHKQLSHLQAKDQVETITLDEYFSPDQRIDFIKLDIEGSEGKALRGMKRILSGNVTLIFEYFPGLLQKAGEDPRTLLQYLEGFGFHFYDLESAMPDTAIGIDDLIKNHPTENRKISNLTNLLCKKS